MSTKAYAERLSRALESTGLVEPVNATHSEGRVAVLCRVAQGNEKKWLELVKNILVNAIDESKEVHAWQTHLCRNYFIKETESGRNLVWGWNVSVHSREMSHSLDVIIKIIKGQAIRSTGSKRELEEFPLHGASADRNSPKNGKGVHTIGGKAGDFSPARSK